MRTYFICLLYVVLFGAVSCSDKAFETPRPSRVQAAIGVNREIETRTAVLDAAVDVGLDVGESATETATAAEAATATATEAASEAASETATETETRASLRDDWETTSWSDGDRVALWAKMAGGGYALSGTAFDFYHRNDVNAGIFTANIERMADGEYDYFAVYPASLATGGTQVGISIPSVQDGTYRAEYDVMTSSVVSGGALTDDVNANIRLEMHHRCHAMRIRIPSGKNYYGKAVVRLLIDFPFEVAGTLTFDASDPDAAPTLTDGTKRIDLQLAEPLDASDETSPQYVWIFLAPGAEVSGDIAFTPVLADGFCAATLSAKVNKSFAAGHVTPVNMAVSPVEQTVTWIDFTIDHSQLGEAVNTLTVTAPEGALFRKGQQTESLAVSDGKCSVGYYAILYQSEMSGATLPTATFDSNNAVVTGDIALPTLTADTNNAVGVKAPWLYYNDFSCITSTGERSDTILLRPTEMSSAGLTDWYFTRYIQYYTNQCVVLRQKNVSIAYDASITTAANIFEHLKDGASVSIKVAFYSGCSRRAMTVTMGTTTSTAGDNTFVQSTSVSIPYIASIDQTNVATGTGSLVSGSVSAVTNTQRLKWYVKNSGNGATGQYDPIYIDNVMISITQ